MTGGTDELARLCLRAVRDYERRHVETALQRLREHGIAHPPTEEGRALAIGTVLNAAGFDILVDARAAGRVPRIPPCDPGDLEQRAPRLEYAPFSTGGWRPAATREALARAAHYAGPWRYVPFRGWVRA